MFALWLLVSLSVSPPQQRHPGSVRGNEDAHCGRLLVLTVLDGAGRNTSPLHHSTGGHSRNIVLCGKGEVDGIVSCGGTN